MSLPEESITQRPLEEVLPEAFLGYSKFVILHRAIPDVRDGLKPVHRRIIFGMNELSMNPDKPYSKSARLVGHVMGSYHPHGDSAIYEAAVRMAQPWATRYTFVDGHGNFGSVDGDPAAAMRYTEMRMTSLAKLMCDDLEKNTVVFKPNYDNRLDEPTVLPSPIPNVLVNGTSGIAVGLSTNMAPHNLREVISGLLLQIDNPDVTIEELMTKVPGPDFPTGGFIVGTEGIIDSYKNGRGRIIMRGKANIISGKNGKNIIVISEIPYQVNKANLAAKIETLAEDKIEGIADVRDESDREGMRLVVEVRKDHDPYQVLNQLYKYSQLQETFGIINLVITAEGVPKVLGLKEINQAYIDHRREVVIKRTEYDLAKAKARAHILEGLVIAINNLDEVIALIRSAKNPAIAKASLITRFELSELQAQAVLDMKLQHLTNLELDSIRKEYSDILILIASLEEILGDIKKVYEIIKKELRETASKFGDERRTVIVDGKAAEVSEMVNYEEPESKLQVVLTHQGYIKQIPVKSRKTVLTFNEDYVSQIVHCTTNDSLYFFSKKGNVYSASAKIVPEGKPKEKGKALANLFAIPENESIISVLPLKVLEENQYFVFITKEGQVMRTPVTDFRNLRTSEAMGLKGEDELVKVFVTDGNTELFIVTRTGQCIRFSENEINPMGKRSKGVKGMSLTGKDVIIDAQIIQNTSADIVTFSERGWIKRTRLSEYKPQNRGGKGVTVAKLDLVKTGELAAVEIIEEDTKEFAVIQKNGSVTQINPENCSIENRTKWGKGMIDVMLDDLVTKVLAY